MSAYIKFLKDILSNKRSLEEYRMALLNLNYSVILSGIMPSKLEDPGKFIIPCILGRVSIKKALYDLGASVNLISHIIFERMDICELKPT
jgi:hypothetical protein